MPDLTLYHEDVSTIRAALLRCRREVLKENDIVASDKLDRLRDLLYERIVQGLHPVKQK
jgi:hypothetical protein